MLRLAAMRLGLPVRPEEDRSHAIAEEAQTWLERLERTLRPDEIAAFRAWLKVRPHRECIVKRCKLWHGPEILAVLGELVPLESFAARVERQYGRVTLAIFLAVSGMGFATVLIAGSKLWPGADEQNNPLRAKASYQTPIGGRLTLPLPDGGLITLNSATQLLIDYGPHARDVTLLRGEASFDVVYDEARPFHVFASPRRFETGAARSQFNVRKVSAQEVEVLVLEGEISAAYGSQRTPMSAALLRARPSFGAHTFQSGEGGRLGAGWQLPRAYTAHELRARVAWRDGLIVFSDEPLEDALAEIERYVTTKFVLTDDRLRKLRLSGEFRTDDLESLLLALCRTLDVEVRTGAAGQLLLGPVVDSGRCASIKSTSLNL
jgi:transmembrane sensor